MTARVCVVITARPSYSRIRSALEAMQARPELDLKIVLAGSAVLEKYGNMDEVVQSDGFEVAARVHAAVEGASPEAMVKTTGLSLLGFPSVFESIRPDAVLCIADRFETIATSIAASYMNIPLIHVQGGEQTGSIDDKVRHANTMLADLHLVSTSEAARRVRQMGRPSETIHVTGCPSIDIAAELCGAGLNFDPYERYGGVGARPSLHDGYIVVLQHPVTDEHEAARQQTVETLSAVEASGRPVLWFWPNMDAGSDGTASAVRSFRERAGRPNFHFFKNMAPADFLRLITDADALVGNSSVGIRESSYLGVPVVNIGSRQQMRQRGENVVDVEPNRADISLALERQLRHGPHGRSLLYGDGTAGQQIASRIAEADLA